jgi:hypothetical protein
VETWDVGRRSAGGEKADVLIATNFFECRGYFSGFRYQWVKEMVYVI